MSVIIDPNQSPDTIRLGYPTRADVLTLAERLRAAAGLLEAHARHCTDEAAAAHAVALRRARGMVRPLTSEGERQGHE